MKAIELTSKTDRDGHLRIDYKLNRSERNVRILILIDDDDISEAEEAQTWLSSIAKNPAFDFLNEPSEDLYTLKDGIPFKD